MTLSDFIESFRVHSGTYGSSRGEHQGLFVVPYKNNETLQVIASDGLGWEHVSVSHRRRVPTWDMMCFIKENFWGPEEMVIQYHPKKSEYVNNHPFCLHLWKPINFEIPSPPTILVGEK